MTGTPSLAMVVEGHGEVAALPVLVRRIASELYGVHHIEMRPPFRVNRNKMAGEALANAARVVSASVAEPGGILVVADADDDCAIELAQAFRKSASPTPVEIAIAVREFESWFLGAVSSLRSHRAVRDDANFASDPESRRDAKGLLGDLMAEPYRETLHQPAFAGLIDLDEARQVRSFAHLVACVGRLLGR